MSLFALRFHNPVQLTTRRAYSSFFSSKPGGGRYFNSAKPPKPVVDAAGKEGKGESGGKATSNVGNSSGNNLKTKADEKSAQTTISTRETPSPPSPSPATPPTFSPPPQLSGSGPVHPSINPQDYKLHQFFSLHRPLLTLSQPVSSIFTASQLSQIPFSHNPSAETIMSPPVNLGTFDDPPEASAEADADAARQLARALVMNRVGGAVSWEDALRRLGVDVDAGRDVQAKEFAREWEVYMDSTKRKRRKKMKKHKLKKRRKLQRAQRLKIGR